jgi:hypothetical protein
MGDIDRIEAARGGPLRFLLDGERYRIADPKGVGYQLILAVLHDPRYLTDLRMPEWKRTALAQAWAAHYDLPEFNHAKRLCYLVDRYADPLISDLRRHAGIDMLELWRDRRWRTLLAIIDRLPPQSAYAVSVSEDPEHSEMLANALAERAENEDGETKGPSAATWTPEVDVLTALRDDVRILTYTVRASNGDKKAQPPKPLPRPFTPLERAQKKAEFSRRKSKHDSLVARMLPHKGKS